MDTTVYTKTMNQTTRKPKGKEDLKMKTKPFEIPSILESYRSDVVSGAITIEQAVLELYKAGWMCFDVADAKRLLEIN